MSTAAEIITKMEDSWRRLAKSQREIAAYQVLVLRRYLRHVHRWRGKRIVCHGPCKMRGLA